MGAGKTTFYEAYLKEAFPSLVPPVRHQQQAFLNDRRSFAVEDIRVDTHLLDEASDPGAPDYPYGEPGQIQRTRRIAGGRF